MHSNKFCQNDRILSAAFVYMLQRMYILGTLHHGSVDVVVPAAGFCFHVLQRCDLYGRLLFLQIFRQLVRHVFVVVIVHEKNVALHFWLLVITDQHV